MTTETSDRTSITKTQIWDVIEQHHCCPGSSFQQSLESGIEEALEVAGVEVVEDEKWLAMKEALTHAVCFGGPLDGTTMDDVCWDGRVVKIEGVRHKYMFQLHFPSGCMRAHYEGRV